MSNNRQYPAHPLLGVGAIIFRDDCVLLVERGKEPLKGWWSLPGGLLEVGELLVDGVRREVLEETGLEVQPLGAIEIFERIMHDQAGALEYHYVLVDYVCRATGGTLRAGDDASEVEWWRRCELPQLRITEGTLAIIEKAFRERGKFILPRI